LLSGLLLPLGRGTGRYGALCHGPRRRAGGRSAVTPATSGGSPAAAHIAPHQAARCPSGPACAGSASLARPRRPSARSAPPTGDQEARSSKPVACGSSRLAPNPSVTTRVTVPLGAAEPEGRASSASGSQDPATSPTTGSAPIS